MITIKIPDIGGEHAEVVEILVKPGDTISVDDALITLEGDKSTMEVPATHAGKVQSIAVKVGDKVAEGDVILALEGGADVSPSVVTKAAPTPAQTVKATPSTPSTPVVDDSAEFAFGTEVYAGPGVRRIAQEFGVNLRQIKGTGEKGRITKEDVQRFVKAQLKLAATGGGLGFHFPELPKIDFAKFGAVKKEPLSKIKKFSGASLHRNWVSIPHVTQFDEADITELEQLRKELKASADEKKVKLTPIVFIMKALVATLKAFPLFNASLDETAENLILKSYFNIGVAVDTPTGLVVPVIREVDQKDIYQLAKELGDISAKAREKGLATTDMQGGCFTISSLGGIGGTAFTPIINAPEVAILGVSRSQMRPVYEKEQNHFVPRLMLPLSLSYDHRVIDGADGARFIVSLAHHLAHIRNLVV